MSHRCKHCKDGRSFRKPAALAQHVATLHAREEERDRARARDLQRGSESRAAFMHLAVGQELAGLGMLALGAASLRGLRR